MFDKALEKLWTHGGALVDFAENVSRGHDQWRESYIAQGEQKRAQIDQMIRYAESNQCRMASLVRHFGDLADGEKPCGICDFCAPRQCAAQRFRTATEGERAALLRVVAVVALVVVVAALVVWVVLPGVVVEPVGSVLVTGRVLTPPATTPYRTPP